MNDPRVKIITKYLRQEPGTVGKNAVIGAIQKAKQYIFINEVV